MFLNNTILLDFLGFPICFWWWLLGTLGAFLLGWLLHWFLFTKKYQDQIDQLEADNKRWHKKAVDMEEEYMAFKYKCEEGKKDISGLKANLRACRADKAVLEVKLGEAEALAASLAASTASKLSGNDKGADEAMAMGATGADEKVDYAALLGTTNLQIVEGIGPKIESLLKDGGIPDWATLGQTSVERLREILDAAGSRYRIHDPSTWSRQAGLAAEGKWDDLIEYQKFTDGGRETKGDFETPAKVEKLLAKKLGFSTNPEDLKIVEGVGPKIEGLLKAADINNWTDLANTSVEKLKEILANAGDRYRLADPSTWAEQAGMAAKGDWDALHQYQEFLDGGKKPG